MAKGYLKIPDLTLQDKERYWNKVGIGDDCWEWQEGRKSNDYGRFKIGKRFYGAHRIAYKLANGDFSPELLVCHHCDNPCCCNPSHLFLGTPIDNNYDMHLKGRAFRRSASRSITERGRKVRLEYEERLIRQQELKKQQSREKALKLAVDIFLIESTDLSLVADSDFLRLWQAIE